METTLQHIGMPRRSGRYPWGSGENPYQSNQNFLGYVDQLRKEGLTESQIAEAVGISTTELRAKKAIAKQENRQEDQAFAQKLKDKNYSNVAIAKRMDIPESTVRNLLKDAEQNKKDVLFATADVLRQQVADKTYLDVGSGTELELGISQTKLNTAVALLKEEGYSVHTIKVEQLGTGNETRLKVLVPPGTEYSELIANRDKIMPLQAYTEDGGLTYLNIKPPKNFSSKRLEIAYDEDGGSTKDGVIELRRGVDDISLGEARYAQVRVQVDGTHFIKGMAMYSDDLPDGVDIRFNVDKKNTGNKLDALKELKRTERTGEIDTDNPFGATIKPGGQHGVLNIVNEEGDWDNWSRTLSSQMLSKQNPSLAKKQLKMTLDQREEEFNEILSLTNPTVRRKLLESYADGADADAVHLKAAALPRQRTQVILPMNSMKEGEIFAPNFRNGEKVVLVRYPHGGTFEIPELTVNNKNQKAKKAIGLDSTDAVGIHHKVAARLSGADFDGDTVLVIPNNDGKIKVSAPLKGLKNFNPKVSYPLPKGKKPMTEEHKQTEMGVISNLITDMTIKGATQAELAKAVRHSMVVIDAVKHGYDYKLSEKDNGIKQLRQKYQAKPNGRAGGASTLISRASSEERVRKRKPRPFGEGGPIDPKTGKKVYVDDGPGHYINKKGQKVALTTKSTKMYEADDAFSLSSGTAIETVYASHANKLKALGNAARKETLKQTNTPYSRSARETYNKEVASLNASLNQALRNAPLERRAQVVANATVRAKIRDNPSMESESIGKIKGQALSAARNRVGAKKVQVSISPREWEAIQAGAISPTKLARILDNADLDTVKAYATPRANQGMTPAKISRARAMLNNNYTTAEVADALGVSTSTLRRGLE